MLVYSFLTPGQYGNVDWDFSTDAWLGILYSRDIFDGTLQAGRRASDDLLAVGETVVAHHRSSPFSWAFRPPGSSPRARRAPRALWLFLITIPFWTNLLIRTFAINEIIRNEGLLNTLLIKAGRDHRAARHHLHRFRGASSGMTYVYLPLMVLPLFAAIDRFDMRLLEAGYDLYASRWQVLRRIIMPIVQARASSRARSWSSFRRSAPM